MTARPKTALASPGIASPGKPSTTCSGQPDPGLGALQRECSTFCRYLSGTEPDSYVYGKYVDYHRDSGAFASMTTFEALAVSIAVAHPWLTRIADSYSARFDRCSPLRKKLALLLAVLEFSPGYFERVDVAWTGPRLLIFFRMTLTVVNSAVALAVSLPLLGPLHLAMGRGGRMITRWIRSS
jgi:hypothetical protein